MGGIIHRRLFTEDPDVSQVRFHTKSIGQPATVQMYHDSHLTEANLISFRLKAGY